MNTAVYEPTQLLTIDTNAKVIVPST